MVQITNLVRLGFCNKKLILPFGVAFFQISINIMNLLFDEPKRNNFLESIDSALGQMAIALIPMFNICTFNSQTKKTPKRSKIRNFLHFFILYFIFGNFLALNIIKTLQSVKYMQQMIMQNKTVLNHQNTDLSSLESLELIFIYLVSILLLKYKYFIHHTISIIVFVLTNIFIDLILGNFPILFDKGIVFIILSIGIVIIDALDYGYQKYMMDVFCHSYWSIPLTLGIANFSVFSVIIIMCLTKGKQRAFDEKNQMIMNFFSYFDEVSVGIIVGKHILNIILNFFLNLFLSLTILYFSPDFILISFTISRMLDMIIETKEYVCIIFFVLQFITLMFYLEIFEFNFWGLNNNTRRKNHEREVEEMILSSDRDIKKNSDEEEDDTNIVPTSIIDAKDRETTLDISAQKKEDPKFIYEMNEKSAPE